MKTLHQNTTTRLRNLGIIAHVDAGKTTVSERILYYTGRIHEPGEVHNGKAALDTDDREKNHGITINSAATTVEWREHQINLIDTPGHVDFGIEVKRALRVLDGAVVVFDAVSGVEPQTETNWRMADEFGVARIAFVNKMDRPGADFGRVADMMVDRLGVTPLPIQLPVIAADGSLDGIVDLVQMLMIRWLDEDGKLMECVAIPDAMLAEANAAREKLIEAVIEQDADLLTAYLADGSEPSADQLIRCLRSAIATHSCVPLLCGTALKNRGVQPLLDAIVDLLPNPLERTIESLADDVDDSLLAYAFKTVNNSGFGSQTWLRIYAGELNAGDRIWNATRQSHERIGRIVRVNADREEVIDAGRRGDIVAVLGMKETLTGDTLCASANKEIVLERLVIPEPVTSVAIETASREDHARLGVGLNRLVREDPTLHVSVDSESGQSVIAGMGELHLEMAREKLEGDLSIKINFGRPQVNYRETIRTSHTVLVRHHKQDGGTGQYADVEIRFEPLPCGDGFEFVSEVTGGAIPKEYIPGVEKGIRSAMQNGPVGGHPVVDIRAVLLDGKAHDNDSSLLAFEIAGSRAFREAVSAASPVLLEPIMRTHVTTPLDHVGDVIGDLSRRRGLVQQQSERGNATVVEATVPLAKLFGYIGDLRSLSSGRASFTMEFDHYAETAA